MGSSRGLSCLHQPNEAPRRCRPASPGATARAARASWRSARNGAPRSRPGSTRRCPRSALLSARLLIVGLAPGVRGANRTGRPFTGDYAGDLLYATLKEYGFARGVFEARPDDSLELIDARITNGVRCVPPENKPTPAEINTCRDFLKPTIAEMPKLRAIVTLGRIAHETTVRSLGAQADGGRVQPWRPRADRAARAVLPAITARATTPTPAC